MKYTPWAFSPFCQRPETGSRWFFGNFALGVTIDSHPRFRTITLCLLFVELGLSWTREAIHEFRRGYVRVQQFSHGIDSWVTQTQRTLGKHGHCND